MADSWHVYIALLENGCHYVGRTQAEPEERILRHQKGLGGSFTRRVKIVRLLWQEAHPSLQSAHARERQLKGWSYAKKKALIQGDALELKRLACSRQILKRKPPTP